MSLLLGAVAMGRSRAAARFTETFTAYTETKVLDEDPESPTAGEYVTTENIVHADVPGRLKFPTMTVRELAQGGQVPATQDVHIHVAVGATPGVAVDTMWRCTGSIVDSALVGGVWRTKGVPQAGQVTAHRYPVESVA